MALYSRVNTNTFSLLNLCYCKFTTNTVKLKARQHTSFLSNSIQEKLFNDLEREEPKRKVTKFENEIADRRSQARRSILVQVYSSSSYDELQNYCAKFGKILSMHHYRTDKQHNYILIEFKNISSVNEIISFASFVDKNLIAPVKSSVLWFHKGQVVNTRINQKKITLTTENGYINPSENQITHILYNAKSISGQIIDLYDAVKLNELESRLRFHTAHHLEQYFSGLFCNIKVLPFGSSINGFGRRRCDLDLVLISDDVEEKNPMNRLIFHAKPMKMNERHETKEFMGVLACTMQHFIPGVCNVRKILEARVPIIKFKHEYTRLECDLSTINTTGIYMSELLNLYGEIDWRVRPLITAIRKWAKSQNITSDSPGPWITNFSLSLLVIFYLQEKKILPSLKTLKLCATRDDMRIAENNIDCTFLRDVQKLPKEYKYKSNQDSLETLLFGFFEYYSTFDFYTKGICIREGAPIRKPANSALYIVNPLETTLNVSKNVNVYELNRIVEKTHNAVFVLESTDKSKDVTWGFMALLKVKNDLTLDAMRINDTESQNIEDYSKNYFPQDSNKIISETHINQLEKTKKTI